MFAAIEPWKLGVAGKEIGPAFERIGHFDAYLFGLLHDRRAGIRRENIGPKFGARKATAHIHDEIAPSR